MKATGHPVPKRRPTHASAVPAKAAARVLTPPSPGRRPSAESLTPQLSAAPNDRRSYGLLWEAYAKDAYFAEKRERTRNDYLKVRMWLGEAAWTMFPASLTSEEVLALRDKAFAEKGRRFANYVIQVLRLTIEWGRPRGWLRGNPESNPAMSIRLLPRPKGARTVNRAWKDAEVHAFLQHAPPTVRLAFALGLFAGMREGDVVSAEWVSYDGATLEWRSRKNSEPNAIPVSGVLKALLESAWRARRPTHICQNSFGRPWKNQSSLRAAFFRTVNRLQAEGLLGPGTTFHGLRHTVGAFGRNSGASDFHVAAALGDRSIAMAALYGANADRRAGQFKIMSALQEHFSAEPF